MGDQDLYDEAPLVRSRQLDVRDDFAGALLEFRSCELEVLSPVGGAAEAAAFADQRREPNPQMGLQRQFGPEVGAGFEPCAAAVAGARMGEMVDEDAPLVGDEVAAARRAGATAGRAHVPDRNQIAVAKP